MNIKKFRHQCELASRRYQAHAKQRKNRQQHLGRGEWSLVDSPDRIYRRLVSLGETNLISESMGRGGQNIEVLERIIGEQNDLLSADFIRQAFIVSRSTGRVAIRSLSGNVVGFGTGFLVSRRLMLTNNHVLESKATAAHSTMQFNFVERFDGGMTSIVEYGLQPGVFFQTNEGLDFTLVAVEPVTVDGRPLDANGWSPFIEQSGKTIVGERVNIIQHPGGDPQQVALRSNRIVDVVDDFLHYQADTKRGSSGSGVFNDQWELSALHHAGVPSRDQQRRILLRNGSVWDGGAHTRDDIDWVANEGVRISRIVSHLKKQSMSQSEIKLFEEAFETRPDIDLLLGSTQAADETSHLNQWHVAAVDTDGRATWTIPLHVSVNLGLDSRAASMVVPPARLPASGSFQAPSFTADNMRIQNAWRRVEEFADRTYYDEEADIEAIDAYYAGLDEQPTPRQMFEQLSKLVRETHLNDHGYSTMRHQHLYPWVDLHENEDGTRELRSVYSGKNFDPREIIRLDIEIELRREQLRRELMLSESITDEDEFQERIDEIEASNPFNCEHVVPQSWFNKQRPMKTDLHHLFTCESDCNSFRSNIPYYQFRPEEEKVRTDCGERVADKFEPAAGKGEVARATLYFLLRYPGQIGDEPRELQQARLNILLDWHAQHEVTLYERHRNAAIFEVQGNRNPLIDWPDWAAQADVKLAFG